MHCAIAFVKIIHIVTNIRRCRLLIAFPFHTLFLYRCLSQTRFAFTGERSQPKKGKVEEDLWNNVARWRSCPYSFTLACRRFLFHIVVYCITYRRSWFIDVS